MISGDKIDELAARLTNAIPDDIKLAQTNLKKTFLQILLAGINKMDLVTREEFEVQTKVLARTREKLAVLEKQFADLEKND